MRLLPSFIVLAMLFGCSDIEQRRQHTLERMDWRGGTAEDQRVQQLVVAALEQADTQSLQTPHLVNVTMRVIADDTQRGSLRVDWIAAQPKADAIRIRFPDGRENDIAFDEIEKASNAQEARSLVLFGGNLFVEREHPEVWERLMAEPDATVVLIADGKPLSEEQGVHRVQMNGG